MYEDTLPHPATFIRSELFDKVGLYDESLKIVADWKFFIVALVKYDASYRYIDKVFSTFYFDGISSAKENIETLMQEREKVITDEFSILKEDTIDYLKLRHTIRSLRSSRKVKWLTKFNLINRF